VYVGVQHGALIRDIVTQKRALVIAVCVGVVSLLKTNLTYGFVAGFILEGLFLVWSRVTVEHSSAPGHQVVEKR
jgi:putative Mn2+ efflux pump MntP